MNKEFLENYIFEKEKDKNFGSSNLFYNYLSKVYKIKDTRKEIYSNLYKRIINYQVDKYGCSLSYKDGKYTLEETLKNARRVYESKQRRKKRGK